MSLMIEYGPNLFAGTAEYYAKYRAKYPSKMFADVVDYFDLNRQGNLLDLGCGTGELAIPLAKYFNKVLALDPQPQMLQQAKIKANRQAIDNIEWQIGSSKSLTGVSRLFKLVVLGQSLHWMEPKTVMNQLYDLIEPSGGLFIVGGGGVSILSTSKNLQAKDKIIRKLIIKYLGVDRRAGNLVYQPNDLNWEKDLFPNSKFSKFQKQIYRTKVVRNIEQELGNLYSMSWARREYFGSKIDQFEAEFRHSLQPVSAAGKFQNSVIFEAYFMSK